MSVGTVLEMWSRRDGGYESPDGKVQRQNFTTSYSVDHSADATTDEILAASSLPDVGDLYPSKDGVFCTRVFRESAGPVLSYVTATWTGEGTGSDSVIDNPPIWTWTNTETSEPVDTDADGFPLTNVNGDLQEGLTKEVSDFTLTVERNFQTVNTYALIQYLDSTNSDPFGSPDSIWPPGTGTLRRYVAKSQLLGALSYYHVTAQFDFRVPYNTVAARAWWYRYRNQGLYVRVDTTVTFSGGGGTGAAGYVTSSAGGVTNVVVTNGGRGYTSAPTVTITSSGTGSGATATANIAGGKVTSCNITAAGTGYKSGLMRAIDRNKEPITTPILLNAKGEREYDASAAIFIERKKKTYSLPYNALGLF